MTTLSTANPTLADAAVGEAEKGIVELLAQKNEVLQDITCLQANDGSKNTSVIRTGLPTGTWRALYEGVQPSKSTTASVTDTAGMLVAYSEVDKALIEMATKGITGDDAIKKAKRTARLNEDAPFIEGLSQQVAQGIFYSSTATAPRQFHGLAPRYNDLNAGNKDNIIDAGGTGSDNTSIWLAAFHPQACHLFYPQGTQAGLKIEDRGQQTVTDSSGKKFEAYVSHYQWHVGLALRDWRSVVRIANIDISDLNTDANTKNLVRWMIEAAERIQAPAGARVAFYCNRRIKTKLRLGILEKIANNLAFDTVSGKSIMRFDEYPVRICDALTNAEARVIGL